MGLFKVTREGESEVDLENMGVTVLHSPTYNEQYKEPSKRSWANEDGDDVYFPISRKTKSQKITIEFFCEGNDYLSNYRNFCIFMASKKFTWRDENQGVTFGGYCSESSATRHDVAKKLTGKIIINNNTGRYGTI